MLSDESSGIGTFLLPATNHLASRGDRTDVPLAVFGVSAAAITPRLD